MSSEIEKKVKEFESLLSQIVSLEDKKKSLWIQIYENAIIDRENASVLYNDLLRHVTGNSTEHAMHGANLAKYLERMSRSNDQLIKLSEIITEVQKDENELDTAKIFEQISKRK
jgi:hypothetical protein